MPHKMQQLRLSVEGQSAPTWPSYEAMNEEALRAADVALGRDVEQLAIDCGLSRRELNKQRERTPDDDQGGPASLGRQSLYRAALFLDTVRQRFGAERCKPAARLVAKACGVQIAEPVAASAALAGDPLTLLRQAISSEAELAQAAQLLGQALADGRLDPREARELLPEFDEAIEIAQGIRNAVAAAVDFPLTFGRKA